LDSDGGNVKTTKNYWKEHGQAVLRLPHDHADLNPIKVCGYI